MVAPPLSLIKACLLPEYTPGLTYADLGDYAARVVEAVGQCNKDTLAGLSYIDGILRDKVGNGAAVDTGEHIK